MENERRKPMGVKRIILITSGKGGVGKSTVTASLAIALQKEGKKVGVLDADIFGPSMPIIFGIKNIMPEVIDLGDGEKYIPIKKYGIELISIGNFLKEDQAIIWRGILASKTLTDLIDGTIWNDIDVLLIDMPPGTSDIHITIAQQYDIDGAIIVTTPQRVAYADALKSGRMLQNKDINTNIIGVVENMSYFITEKLPEEKFYIFGKGGGERLAEVLSTEYLGSIPITEALCAYSDLGNPEKFFDVQYIADSYKKIANSLIKNLNI